MSPRPFWTPASLLLAICLVGCSTTQNQQAESNETAEHATGEAADQREQLSDEEASGHPGVKIGPKSVAFLGEEVLSSTDGSSRIVTPLLRALQPAVKEGGTLAGKPLVIEVEASTSHRLLSKVVYTSREAGVETFKLRWPEEQGGIGSTTFRVRLSDWKREVAAYQKKPLALGVVVTPTGFNIHATGAYLPAPKGCPPQGPTICKADSYDFGALQDKLVEIKEHYSEEKRVTLRGDQALDARLIGRIARQSARTADGEPLFPDAILAFGIEPPSDQPDPQNPGMAMNARTRGFGTHKDDADTSKSTPSDDTSMLTVQTFDVTGSLSEEFVQKIIQKHQRPTQYCFETELSETPDISGQLSVKMTISPDGDVISAEITDSNLGNASVESCVAAKLGRWVFPEPHEETAVVRIDYAFDPQPAP